ncbi:MAG TPA: TPM domain-containing protein [Xanthobacteraceae bacterium]|nr:TPM domain-containing protein [Xanthobacteraceae bacterium]
MRILRILQILLVACAAAFAIAAPASAETFPALTGRVVDEADILDPATRSALAAILAGLEEKTSDQIVVATVPSLQGDSIEVYANRLANRWGLGQKDKNNGVLLLVAPSERKVRIEVGYGLGSTLTDGVAKYIIDQAILPRFRSGDMTGGVTAGITDIVAVLSGDAESWKQRAAAAQ